MTKTTDTLKRFGDRVREARKAKGFSQESFAAACRLDRTYISSVERGKRNISLLNIKTIASELGLSISELMKGL